MHYYIIKSIFQAQKTTIYGGVLKTMLYVYCTVDSL